MLNNPTTFIIKVSKVLTETQQKCGKLIRIGLQKMYKKAIYKPLSALVTESNRIEKELVKHKTSVHYLL